MQVTKNSKTNFLKEKAGAALAPIDYLREVRVELEKVVWPSRYQTIKLTIIVIIVTLLVGFFLGGIDYLLTNLTSWLLSR
jgi:preprotein translocase subunit SecE